MGLHQPHCEAVHERIHVEQEALKEFKHIKPKQHYNGPSKLEPPNFGQKIQYAKEDKSPKVSKKMKSLIQQFIIC